MNDVVAATRKYRVLYSVTRMEYYEIEATSRLEAVQRAFRDGKLVDAGETTDVSECDIEEITRIAQLNDEESTASTTSGRSGTRDTPEGRSLHSNRRPG